MRRFRTILGIAILCLGMQVAQSAAQEAAEVPALSTDSAVAAPARDPRWATPIQKPGLPNLYKVSDDLYRGAQPDAEGFKQLAEMGVKTVVNLRSFHSDGPLMGDVALGYERIYVKAWHAEDEDLVKFLRIVTDRSKTPVFVHCQHGADRTGMMVAVYRIVVQGWSKEDAIKEMTEGGFGWHPLWDNLRRHIENLDVDAIRREAGLSGKEAQGDAADAAPAPAVN